MRKSPERLPPLDLLGAFEAAARHLSFTKAGTERFVTQSAISRQIIALEEDLGVALFVRRHRSLALTDDGRRLYETCTGMLAQLRSTVAQIRAPATRQVLALTTSPAIASLWLIPRLPLFIAEQPGIDVRIDATVTRRDLAADGFDLSIRAARAGSHIGTPLGGESIQPVCCPQLARDRTRPLKTPSDLRLHTLLQVTIPPATNMPLEWDPWLQAVGLADLRPAATLSFSNYDEAIMAALTGQGVALGRWPLIDSLLKSRKLVAPFKKRVASPRAYFLQVAPAARAKPAVQAFERWLLKQLGGKPAGG
jgi:LysR family glycine cleavage system transcriptional activator